MSRKEIAIENFKKGYNCCQSVVLAFKDLVDIDEVTLSKIACGFGGGMGRLREVCGAVSGMIIITNLLYGYDTPETGQIKAELYKKVQILSRQFETDNNSIVCRELMNLNEHHSEPLPTPRTEDFYVQRPCLKLIAYAAQILEEYINNHPHG